MLLKDFLVTPIYLAIIYIIALVIKESIKDPFSKKILLPAFSLKLFSAITLGLIYQFYYKGGDTFFYFDQSVIVRDALIHEPLKGLKLLLSNGQYDPSTFLYANKLHWYRFPTEFTVIKIAALFNVLAFGTYSTVAIFFAIFSFMGEWAMYKALIQIKPEHKKAFSIGLFFIPSVVFWGSGLLKDSLMIGCIGFLFYGFYKLFIRHEDILKSVLYILLAFVILYFIRIYVLLGFVPPALVWIFIANKNKIRSTILRRTLAPLFMIVGLVASYLFAMNITEGHSKYDLSKIPERTKINAAYLYNVSIQEGGSAYYLGDLDGSIESMVRIAPQAINVTLFRPYLWEAKNFLMFISATESTLFLLVTLIVLIKVRPWRLIYIIFKDPLLLFSIVFTIIMAFAIGLNSFNFGTLVRYKIPILPFFFCALTILYYYDRTKAA